jgi:charged multivesicular body protein 5
MKMQWLGKLHTVDKEAMKIIKQKRMFNIDQFSFATEGIKDAQNTMTDMKSANNKLWKIAR